MNIGLSYGMRSSTRIMRRSTVDYWERREALKVVESGGTHSSESETIGCGPGIADSSEEQPVGGSVP